MTDMINPNHYRGDRQYEPIAVIEDWGLNYRLGNAVKYISRNGRKPGEDPREGLRKAIWYLEREIASLDKPSQYVPFETNYEDVLEYYGQSIDLDEAWPNSGPCGPVGASGADTVPSQSSDDWSDFWNNWGDKWDEAPGYVTGWDPTLGPVEISQDEISDLLARKDLDQFEDDEIVSTVERRGMIIGFKKDGSSCVLKNGRCV